LFLSCQTADKTWSVLDLTRS